MAAVLVQIALKPRGLRPTPPKRGHKGFRNTLVWWAKSASNPRFWRVATSALILRGHRDDSRKAHGIWLFARGHCFAVNASQGMDVIPVLVAGEKGPISPTLYWRFVAFTHDNF